jgi:GDP-L-fucose synthase
MSDRLSSGASIYVAGHRGMVGSAIVKCLEEHGFSRIVTRTHAELDLTDQSAVRYFFAAESIDYVVLAAAKVGGILANNTFPAEFIYRNLMIQTNVIHEAWHAGIRQLLFLGSSCIYPKFAPQPMKEEYLLTGILEPTNEPYAVAKITGIKMCQSYNRQYGTRFYSVMPTNLYGPGDNYHLRNSHVIPAIIRKYHLAKLAMQGDLQAIRKDEAVFGTIPDDIKAAIGLTADYELGAAPPQVILWGTGSARREFLHVDDMAAACVFLMGAGASAPSCDLGSQPCSFVNIGTGKDIAIREVAELIRGIVGFTGETVYNSDQPDGTPQKLLDIHKINELGWQPKYSLREGLVNAYQWYCERLKNA